jgi:hypothetical protein
VGGYTNHQEPDGKYGFTLRKRDLALISSARSTNLPQVRNKAVQSARWPRGDQGERTIRKGSVKLRAGRQMLAGFEEMGLDFGREKTSNRQHGDRCAECERQTRL